MGIPPHPRAFRWGGDAGTFSVGRTRGTDFFCQWKPGGADFFAVRKNFLALSKNKYLSQMALL